MPRLDPVHAAHGRAAAGALPMTTYWLYRCIAALPLSVSYSLATVIAWLLERVFQYRVKTVDQNLRRAFPNESDAWYTDTRRAFYRQFADVTLETLYGWRMPQSELEKRMRFVGWDPLMSADGEPPKPGILLSIHHGNWEWLTQRASLVASATLDGVYKPLHDKGADRFAFESRSRWGAALVTMKAMGRHVIKHRRQPRLLALLADQSPGRTESAHWSQFLHQDTGFFLGPATLARITQYPVYFAQSRRVARGFYEVHLIEICREPGALTQEELIERYIRLSEETIRQEPESYLWSNRRWKHTRPQATLTEPASDADDTHSKP